MKKLLLMVLLSASCFMHATREPRKKACILESIKQEQLKLTWSSYFWKQVGWHDQNRLAIERDIHLLKAEYDDACIKEIDGQNEVFQKWKNNVVGGIQGLKIPAVAVFICAAYMNAPEHDGSPLGRIQSGLIGSWTTTKDISVFTGSTIITLGSIIARTTSTVAKTIAGSIDSYLRDQYQAPTVAIKK